MVNFSRLGFLSIIGLESLSWVGFLPLSLDFSWLGLIGTAFFIWLFLELCHKFYQTLPSFIYLAAFLGVGLDASSDIFHFYSQVIWWDKLMHFAGGLIVALIIIYIFKPSYFYTILLVSFLGFLYEYWEFLIDQYYFGYSKALGSGPDTVDDMLFNVIGVVTIILLIKFINLTNNYIRLYFKN